MPMVFCDCRYDWHEKGEGDVTVGFKNSKEIIIFEIAHSAISNLKKNNKVISKI